MVETLNSAYTASAVGARPLIKRKRRIFQRIRQLWCAIEIPTRQKVNSDDEVEPRTCITDKRWDMEHRHQDEP